MTQLANIIEQYRKQLTFGKFISDYTAVRDKCLHGKPITRENLDRIVSLIVATLELKLR